MYKQYQFDLTLNHPIVKNHIVNGQALLPGMAYIDLFYQLASQALTHDFKQCAIKNLSIFNPLLVHKDKPTAVKITLSTKQKDWFFRVENAHEANILYCTSELQPVKTQLDQKLGLTNWKQKAEQVIDLDQVYQNARATGLVHKDVIKAQGQCYVNQEGCLIKAWVAEDYEKDCSQYLFHPTLLDSTALASQLILERMDLKTGQNDLYLPLAIDTFYCCQLMRKTCYALIKSSSINRINDITTLTVEYYAENGEQIGQLTKLTGKRLSDSQPLSLKKVISKSLPNSVTQSKALQPPPQFKDTDQFEQLLKQIFSKYINVSIEQFDLEQGFFDLGLQSSQLLSLVQEIEEALSLSLSPSLLFEYTTLSDLIDYLKSKISEQGKAEAVITQHEQKQDHKESFMLDDGQYEFYENEAYLRDHLVNDQPALMGVTYPCLVVQRFHETNPDLFPIELENIVFSGGPVSLFENETVFVQVNFENQAEKCSFKTTQHVGKAAQPQLSSTGSIAIGKPLQHWIDIETILKESRKLPPEIKNKIYHGLDHFTTGSMLKTIEAIYEYNDLTHIAKVDLCGKREKGNCHSFIFDPLLLNSAFMISLPDLFNPKLTTYPPGLSFIPLTVEKIVLYRQMTDQAYIIRTIRVSKPDFISFDAMILTQEGELIAEIINASNKSVTFSEPLAIKPNAVKSRHEPSAIAIIGIAGRYPGAKTISQFWDNLKNGVDSITEIPDYRWDYKKYFDEDKNAAGKIYMKWGGFIEDIDCFDPLFFHISPREAQIMDPQERIFLECAYQTLEDAGYVKESLDSKVGLGHKVGVYVGVMWGEYQLYAAQQQALGHMITLGGGNISSIANRVSYRLNLHGPSMAVDTMCSSSLTAIHLACQSLLRGECTTAIAGGINLSIHPNKYLILSQGQFASSKGRCESFGMGGDGYVPGEGVGAVLLKPIERAIADQDQIYAVIKGSMVNAGGKTSGYTVPSPSAQREVISQAILNAGIPIRQMSYIEAHGTGTKLGDPIEITGLTQAFQAEPKQKPFCYIGSVKSNIGHLESAAGIAGLTKIILQLKHKQLVPSLHSKQLNPNIDFSQTPFIVNQELRAWQRPEIEKNGKMIEYPRTAGISSFGAGGSNAHLIVEEYRASHNHNKKPISITQSIPFLIVLSARTREQVTNKARDLLYSIKENQFNDQTLANIAYTLQVGREAMQERLAMIVTSITELIEKLTEYIQGQNRSNGFYQGQVQKNNETIAVLKKDEDLQNTIQTWIKKKKYGKLLALWVKGLDFNWNKLYQKTERPKRISLPLYPFARERYWYDLNPQILPIVHTVKNQSLKKLHPLLHENTSDLREQRFSSTLIGDEFFLKDHVVKGTKILPGVAYLEMARMALKKAAPDTIWQLENIVWAQPCVIHDKQKKINIALYPDDAQQISFEIYGTQKENQEEMLYSQGIARMSKSKSSMEIKDIEAIQNECHKKIISKQECYQIFEKIGIDYGIGHQTIETMYIGESQVLVRLQLAKELTENMAEYDLHPGIMDGALQASIGLNFISHKTQLQPGLPFALDRIEIIDRCHEKMWAIARYSDPESINDQVERIDIDLCDEQGKVRIKVRGLTTRELQGALDQSLKKPSVVPHKPDTLPTGNILLKPVWDKVPIHKVKQLDPGAQLIIIGGDKDTNQLIQAFHEKTHVIEILSDYTRDKLAAKLSAPGLLTPEGHDNHILSIVPHEPLSSITDSIIIEKQEQGLLHLFRLMGALLKLGYEDQILNWTIVTNQAQAMDKNERINPTHAGIHGLIGVMAKEFPQWNIRLIDLEAGCDWPVKQLLSLPYDRQGHAWLYRKNQWYQHQLIPIQWPLQTEPGQDYREGGVYVIIGGAGTIGQAWSEYMIKTYQAKLIWIGRRPRDAAIAAKIERLSALGPAPYYIAADAARQTSLQRAYQEIKDKFSQINGIIHSAIVLEEESLKDLKEKKFKQGLKAKINVSLRLAQVFGQEPLDFILFFSSLVSLIKNKKQSSYASGCAFSDAYAHQLSIEMPFAVKVINFGYWGQAQPDHQKKIAHLSQIGIGFIDMPAAMQALGLLLQTPIRQIGLINMTRPLPLEGMNARQLFKIQSDSIRIQPLHMANKIKHSQISAQTVKSQLQFQPHDMDDLLCQLLWASLRSSGFFQQKEFSEADLKKDPLVFELYQKWLIASLPFLIRHQFLKSDGQKYSVNQRETIDIQTLWEEWDKQKKIWFQDENMKAHVVLVETTLKALPDIIRGKTAGTNIMFPNSSLELVEAIYKGNQISDNFNKVLADTCQKYIEERINKDPMTKIRIIEIGAGTGGTSQTLFQQLKSAVGHIKEYCYTDLSRAFLIHAEREYGKDNPYLTYQILNIELPIADQAIKEGEYDIVIAANVLHATKNMQNTLQNTKALLKQNGLLLLNEINSQSLFTHLTFGLLKGWWLYEDQELRIPGCPGLSRDSWNHLLTTEGFTPVLFPAEDLHEFGGQIIAAFSDGVVRQAQTRPTREMPVEKKIIQDKEPQKQITSPDQKETEQEKRLRAGSINYLKKIIGNTLKIESHKIDSAEILGNYGIDSIIVIELTNQLNQVFKNLSSTLFFEYQTIDELAQYLIKKHKESLITLLGLDQAVLTGMNNDKEQTHSRPLFGAEKRALQRKRKKRSIRFYPDPGQKSEKNERHQAVDSDIAIIGVSGRYPGAQNITEFWQVLKQGQDCIREIPQERWDWRKYYALQKEPGKTDSKWGGFIDEIDRFDALFFNILPVQVEMMDPQSRLLLESAYESIEDAGYTIDNLSQNKERKIGVFVGMMWNEYQLYGDQKKVFSSNNSSLANQISYQFNFHGPSFVIDTACSSSLYSISLAYDSIRKGESNLALACGVNLSIHPNKYINLSQSGFFSKDGRCRAFGKGGNGFVPGEGVGCLLLKPLSEAIKDKDHIYGVIKSTALNHGGKTNGFTVPNPNAQEEVILQAIQKSGISPQQISYIEAHGTGTKLGDPIEIRGLSKAFGKYTQKKQYCAIGSVKSNVGHLEGAAGIVAVTKVLLQMKYKKLVPSLHCKELNPLIDFKNSPFTVQQELQDWKRPILIENGQEKEYPRIAGISGFGAGGANAHLLIEEYIVHEELRSKSIVLNQQPRQAIIILSAKSREQVKEQAANLLQYITCADQEPDLYDLAYTLQIGRAEMEERLGILVVSPAELKIKLQEYIAGNENTARLYKGKVAKENEIKQRLKANEEVQKWTLKWITQKRYDKLIEFWVKGLVIDWSLLYPDDQPARISLPTYPFAGQRYRIDHLNTESLSEPGHENKEDRETNNLPSLIDTAKITDQALANNNLMKESEMREAKIDKREPIITNRERSMRPQTGHRWSAKSQTMQIITNLTIQEKQKKFIQKFISQYQERTKTSKFYAAQQRKYCADQRTPPYFNPLLKEIHYPLTYKKARGAYVYDVDGNQYIDIAGDYGVNLFGHCPGFLKKALTEQIKKGIALSGSYHQLGQSAKLFCEITGHERVVYCQSGTESLMSAARLARAYSGKSKIAMFQDSYHGHFDGFLSTFTAGVTDNIVKDTLVLKYGSEEALKTIIEKKDQLAAVMVEPVQSLHVDVQPVEFLHILREITARHQIVLIFDEMVTGFRVHAQGAHGYFGIEPDLVAYGKIIGGGITAGAVAGKAVILNWADGGTWKYGDDSKPLPMTFIAGTHTQNPIRLAATLAILEEIKKRSPKLQHDLNQKTSLIEKEINYYSKSKGLPLRLITFGSQFRFVFSNQFTLTQALFLHILNSFGIRYNLHGNCFLTTAHTKKDIHKIIRGIKKSLDLLLEHEFFYEQSDFDVKKSYQSLFNKSFFNDTLSAAQHPIASPSAQERREKPLVSNDSNQINEQLLMHVEKDIKQIFNLQLAASGREHNGPALEPEVVGTDLQKIISEALKISPDQIDKSENLGDMGVDSILWTDLIQRISQFFNIKLTPTLIMNANSIEEITSLLFEKYQKPLQEHYQKSGAGAFKTALHNDKATFIFEKIKEKYGILLPDNERGFYEARQISAFLLENHKDTLWAYYQVQINAQAAGTQKQDTGQTIKSGTHPSLPNNSDIAIIGMSVFLPDAADPREFYHNLLNKKNSIQEIPLTRWDWREHYSGQQASHKTHSKWGAFINHPEYFDAAFFNIDEQKAKLMDPQERIVLQETYRALEDAGIKASSLAGSKSGVFIGYEYSGYQNYLKKVVQKRPDQSHFGASDPVYYLANRVSHTFDLYGPSEAINVNCAASAVSVNRAYYSLLNQESDLAIAGGISLNLSPEDYVLHNHLLSPDGSTRVFDEKANGFTKGEGCAIILLKRLNDALRDNNQIYALIKSCHQNNRGKTKTLSEVNPQSLTRVLQDCYQKAHIASDCIHYIEVDGYATKWGDSIEFEGIKGVFKRDYHTYDHKFCALGSLKSNIGHLEPASGIASIIKIALSMQHQQFPATIGCQTVSDFIDLDDRSHPLYILKENMPFAQINRQGAVVRAGINSFADSGVNVHILMEEYVTPNREQSPAPGSQLIVLSAKTRASLLQSVRKLLGFVKQLKADPDHEKSKISIYDIAFTLQTGRDALPERLSMITSGIDDLQSKLSDYLKQRLDQDCFFENTINYKTKNHAEKPQISDNREALEQALKNHDLGKLAWLWVNGEQIEWQALYERQPRLVSLPTYCFEKKRHWITDHESLISLKSDHVFEEPKTENNRQSQVVACSANDDPSPINNLYSHNTKPLPITQKAEILLCHSIANLLDKPQTDIAVDQDYFEMGLNSMSMVKVIQALQQVIHKKLSPAIMLKHKTISQLVAYLAANYGAELEEYHFNERKTRHSSSLPLVKAEKTGYKFQIPLC